MSQTHFFLIILLIASAADLFVPVLIAPRYYGYSHLRDTISTLGTSKSPVKKYQGLNLIIVGSLFCIFSIGQALSFDLIKWPHVLYIIGIVFFAIGTVMAGIFPEDAQDASESTSGKIHGISSGVGFIFLILNPLSALWIKEFEAARILNRILFPLAIVSFGLFIVSEKRTGGFLKFTGLFQRINLIILYSHLAVDFFWMKSGM